MASDDDDDDAYVRLFFPLLQKRSVCRATRQRLGGERLDADITHTQTPVIM